MMFWYLQIQKTLFPKLDQIFDEWAKLGKWNQDTYNREGWLILLAFLKNGVAKCLACEANDFTYQVLF